MKYELPENIKTYAFFCEKTCDKLLITDAKSAARIYMP